MSSTAECLWCTEDGLWCHTVTLDSSLLSETSCSSLANMDMICLIRPPRTMNTVPEDTKTLWIMTSAQERWVLFSPHFTDDKTEPQERLVTYLGSRAETRVIPSILCSSWFWLSILKNSSDWPVWACLSKATRTDSRVVRAEAKLSPYRTLLLATSNSWGEWRVESFLRKSEDLVLGNLIHECCSYLRGP